MIPHNSRDACRKNLVIGMVRHLDFLESCILCKITANFLEITSTVLENINLFVASNRKILRKEYAEENRMNFGKISHSLILTLICLLINLAYKIINDDLQQGCGWVLFHSR